MRKRWKLPRRTASEFQRARLAAQKGGVDRDFGIARRLLEDYGMSGRSPFSRVLRCELGGEAWAVELADALLAVLARAAARSRGARARM